ncbi:GAF domain-containing protein [Nostoc sp. CMAA1605]|uniref:GAF domain-containing protein n=1 Tax=Nostoc sp. CMAA1605 TaxID=2055159 RepID=UPI001F256743|nr:GAF domain-containing protein [Nostoc sp. CMAA1605]MCF4968719.1 chemotaxis protein [Nostoc sp. CMAA1605]
MAITYQKNHDHGNSISKVEAVEKVKEVDLIGDYNQETSEAIAQAFRDWRQQLQDIIVNMRQANDLDAVLKATVEKVREKLRCDRVFIYQFNSVDAGTVLAESRALGWTPTLGEVLPGIMFGLHSNHEYVEPVAIDESNQIQLTHYQKQLLDKFQIQTSLSVPIIVEGKVWGILAVNSCTDTRHWQEVEATLLFQVTTELTYRVQVFEVHKESQLQEHSKRSLSKVIDKILRLSNIDKISQVATQEVRQLLKCDRVSLYKFHPDWSGEYIAESVGNGWVKLVGPGIRTIWEDTYLQETQGGRYRHNESSIIHDVYKSTHSPCHLDVLEQFEVKAYVIIPVFTGEKLWGLLAVYQNTGPRNWQDWEVRFLSQIGLQLGVSIAYAESLEQMQMQSEQIVQIAEKEKAFTKIVNRIRQAQDVESIFRTTTQEVRQFLKCDRMGVYQFLPEVGGKFVAESVGHGWTPFIGTEISDTFLKDTESCDYFTGRNCVVNDIYTAGFNPCHLELLGSLEARAYVIVPIMLQEELWGLLAIYQNSGTREWQEWEIAFLNQISSQFSIAKSQLEYLQQLQFKSEQLAQVAEKEKAFTKIVNRIRQAKDVESIFRTTTQEIRQFLKCDRAAVYHFDADCWGGKFIAESVSQGWTKLVTSEVKTVLNDTFLQEQQGGKFIRGEYSVVNDIYHAGFQPCHIEILETFDAKAYIIVPIFFSDRLWGLLAVYQNSGPREWQDWEAGFLNQIASQFSLAKSQLDYLEEVRQKTEKLTQITEQEKAFTKIVNRIRQALELEEIFKISTQDVRQLLKCDRVVVFRFNPDWSGLFVAESVGHNWVKLVGPDIKTVWEDTFLQETQGGRYVKGESFVVNDIYQTGHAPCHLEILEQFEARAYVIVPIFFGDKLWGLFAAYQNSGTREWEESEVGLLARIGDQLGLALQQTEYLQKLQTQSAQLAEAAARDKAAKELLQQRSIQLLTAVRPALNGDLTVRAPITEDELGTIADAYNNTLQALRQIVLQVQTSAQKVAQTSSTSNASLAGLNHLAQQQSDEINLALSEIQQMLNATQAVVGSAELVQVAVTQANQTVEAGDAAMNQTVQAIQAIRETVAKTSKKIKRLGESSQKISKVVNLISNFATQTNVLALNAAIEATRAGEYGKGFAVVADEVRSLSRQSAAATIEIEKLVQEIQEETGEVAVAMETGIQQVVEGTNFVNETRQNLNAIVAATAEISQLINQITDATQKQMGQSVSVTNSMKDVAEIATQTFGESQEIAAVFQDLSHMAQDLLTTASKFKVS